MEIKKGFVFTFITYLLAFYNADAVNIINKNYAGEQFIISDNTLISDTGSLDFDDIYISNSVTLINSGKISGNIDVCSSCNIFVQNNGEINAVFNIDKNSDLIQVVHDYDGLNLLQVNGNYNLLVDNKKGMSINEIMNVGKYADKIIFDNSVLFVEDAKVKLSRSAVKNPEIEIIGNTDIYIESIESIKNKVILSNVSGEGTVNIYDNNLDSLYSIKAYIENENLYGVLVRETDYSKILKNKTGEFLDYIRTVNPDDKLLLQLDSAKNMKEFSHIANKSVRLNPINLMLPIKYINSFYMFDNRVLDNRSFNLETFSLLSDDYKIYGGNVVLNNDFSKSIKLSMSLYSAYTQFLDDINDFNSLTFGANAKVYYDNKNFFGNFIIGSNISKFNSGVVLSKDDIIYNPKGYSFYASVDAGKEIYNKNNLFIKPFISANTNLVKVLDNYDFNSDFGAGADIKLSYDEYDIKYDYGIKGKAYVSGQIIAGVYMHFFSDADMAGGHTSINTIYDEIGFSYNLNLGLNINF